MISASRSSRKPKGCKQENCVTQPRIACYPGFFVFRNSESTSSNDIHNFFISAGLNTSQADQSTCLKPIDHGVAHVDQSWISIFQLNSLAGDALVVDLDQLNVEHQGAIRLLLAFVGKILRNPKTGLLAFNHQRHPFSPAGDHIGKPERRRCAALY